MAKREPIRKAPKSVVNMKRRLEALEKDLASAQKRNATEEVKRLKKEMGHIKNSVKDYGDRERQALSGSK